MVSNVFMFAVLLLCVIFTGSTNAYMHTPWHQLEKVKYNFEMYVKEYAKKYDTQEEYIARKNVFQANMAEILEFNRSGRSWKMGVNQFTDRSEVEVATLLGYRPVHTEHVRQNPPHALQSTHVPVQSLDALPDSIDWRKSNVLSAVKDQQSCGSCWAFSTSQALESFFTIETKKRMLVSPQQIASCTQIPMECWGQGFGGCQGSTPLLAYHSIMQHNNTMSEYQYPYRSGKGDNYACLLFPNKSFLHVVGYKVLPTNSYEALMDAVANVGPLAIAVDATYWKPYESGIFDGCSKTKMDINHAVQLVGYGKDEDTGLLYWIVRNSWNVTWGENGYMRLIRNENSECYNDPGAKDCMGGPRSSTVCGDCGILYDASYPIIANTTLVNIA